MNLLLIDTSTKNFSLAVVRGDQVIGQSNRKADKILSSTIVPAINRILSKTGITLKELDGFAVGLGPGSFTSLRVGLATIKALAFAANKPVVGIPSLDVLAMNGISSAADNICTLMDARRNLVFACFYSAEKGRLQRRSGYLLTSVEDVLKKAKGKILFLGDGLTLYQKAIEEFSHRSIGAQDPAYEPLFTGEKNNFPQAAKMLGLALDRFGKKDYDDIDKLVPLYLYPEDCQVRR